MERNATSPGNVTQRLQLIAILLVAGQSAFASPCQFESQSEGRVTAIDARSLRLDDGREIRLTGIEPTATTKQALTSWDQLCTRALKGRCHAYWPHGPEEWQALQATVLRMLFVGFQHSIAQIGQPAPVG